MTFKSLLSDVLVDVSSLSVLRFTNAMLSVSRVSYFQLRWPSVALNLTLSVAQRKRLGGDWISFGLSIAA